MSSEPTARGSASGRSAVKLDETDRAIIAALVEDGRMSIRALADHIHISRANAYARIGRLVSDGAITGFTAHLDARRVGLGTTKIQGIPGVRSTRTSLVFEESRCRGAAVCW